MIFKPISKPFIKLQLSMKISCTYSGFSNFNISILMEM